MGLMGVLRVIYPRIVIYLVECDNPNRFQRMYSMEKREHSTRNRIHIAFYNIKRAHLCPRFSEVNEIVANAHNYRNVIL